MQPAESAWAELMADHFRGRAAWLIRLRWIAVAAILLATGIAAVLDAIRSPRLFVAGAAVLAFGNLVFLLLLRRAGPRSSSTYSNYHTLAQIALDLLLLTVLLEMAGSIENPFISLYVLHMAVAGMLLPFRLALVAGALSLALHGAAVLGQLLGILDHVPLELGAHSLAEADPESLLTHSTAYVVAHLIAFVLVQFGVVVLIHQVARRQRDAEARALEHERVAQSRERFARLGALTAGVAHTVRNPLHGLLNCVDILRRDLALASPETREILDVMAEGVDRIETVTRRLLVLTRDEPSKLEPADLKAVIEDALRFVRVRSRISGVRLDVALSEPIIVRSDPARLIEALANILDNAIYACRAGGTVSVHAAIAGERAVVRITDSGEGIALAARARVFDPFFTTKPTGEGSGLGLAIARRTVEEHGGTIGIESSPGQGTTVSIELPLPGTDHA